jgi:hypothetical protein
LILEFFQNFWRASCNLSPRLWQTAGMLSESSDRNAVLGILEPHLPTLEQVFQKAWARLGQWTKNIEGSPADVSARSRASILYDFIVAEAIKAFIGRDGVRVKKKRQLLVLHFRDRIALRFKKFRSATMRASSNRTRQSERYAAQVLEFDTALTPMTHVVAGYLLDSLSVDIKRLAITCTLNGEHMWEPIEMTSAPQPVKVLPTKAPSQAPAVRVRSARKKSDKEGEGASS